MDRRQILKAAAVAGAYAALPKYSFGAAKGSDKIKVGVIGCSGRGISAVSDMISADKNVCITALADLFPDRIEFAKDKFKTYIEKGMPKDCFDIPESQVFVGWDAYKQLLQTDVDLVIQATPPVFRPLHLRACIEAGKHVFIEKPACVDAVQARGLYETAKLADEKGLSVIGGIQRRFHKGYMEGIQRMWDGQIGDIVGMQCYWLNPQFYIQKLNTVNPDPESMEYQIRNWFIFTWASGDSYVEQHVHNLDIMLWGLKGRKPKELIGIGGRRWDLPVPEMGNRFSHFGIDFDYGDGLRCSSYSRREPGTASYVKERFIGTKGVLELGMDSQQIHGETPWQAPTNVPQCLVEEHRVLIESIRNGKPVNMIKELTDSTVMAITGREAAYSGMRFKYDWVLSKSQKSYFPTECVFGKKPVDPVALPGIYKLS